MKTIGFGLVVVWVSFFLYLDDVRATQRLLPRRLIHELLQNEAHNYLPPNPIGIEDYRVKWISKPIPGVDVQLGPESFESVIVGEVLRLPRGRVLISGKNIRSATIRYVDFVYPLATENQILDTGLTAALSSSPKNQFEMEVLRPDGTREVGRIGFEFTPRKKN